MNIQRTLLAVGLFLTGPLFSAEPQVLEGSYLGKRLPEITAEGGTWLNAEGAVTLKGFRGRPVLVCCTVLW